MSELVGTGHEQLTLFERERLVELEAVIERGLQTFVEVGNALLEIQDSRLYREDYATFVDYLDRRWGMSESRGYQLIDAARISTMVEIDNERQARELVPLLKDVGEDAVEDVVRDLRAKHGERLTAEKVRQAVNERMALEQKIAGITSTGTIEWYTPAKYIAAVRRVLGGIDLDPASTERANETVQAGTFYDLAADGLAQEWQGRVFLNPPYGALCGKFVAKALQEHQAGHVPAAVLLLNGYSYDSAWFQPLWDHLLCFSNHRIRFNSPLGTEGTGTTGSVFAYLGPDRADFVQVFGEFGPVVERVAA